MSEEKPHAEYDADAVFAGRIDILYSLGRHYLSLPFAALSVPATLFGGNPGWLALMPVVLQIVVVVAAEQLTTAYKERPAGSDPLFWARRYTFVSALAGATWGVGAFFWFVPNSFPAQAYLSLAFLGMTATEFIARSAYRPAYITHACFALGPLVALLLMQGDVYAVMSAVLIVFFTAALFSYSKGMGRLLDESIHLRLENAGLVVKLSGEKQEAEAARDAAEASAQAKSSFIANISHELRTPLNAILGMAQLLDRAELERPHRDHVKVMLEAGRGLHTLLDDVIALTRDDVDWTRPEDCDPAQAARAVARLLQPRAWEKHLRLTVTAEANLPNVAADPRRMRQVLLKLADNALKFTERGGVEIRIERDAQAFVRFTVIDTGQGVAPELVPVLFKPFAPGDTSYARLQQGAGLGLAVVRRIVDIAGGQTGFDSEQGKGAAFWFTIPVAAPSQADVPAKAPASSDATPAPTGLRILVLVQDEAVRTHLSNMLEPFGNMLVEAENADDAGARAEHESIDVIVAEAGDADRLAAAPGITAPILALMFGGERAPACADEVLRWPANPHELYAAIAAMRERMRQDSQAEPPPQNTVAAIDAAAFAELENSLGIKTLLEILKSYIESAEQLCRSLSQASDEMNWPEASRLAQDIAGSAGGLGLAAMTAAARGFSQQAREGAPVQDLRETAQTIVWEHERVRRALANLYPDLAA